MTTAITMSLAEVALLVGAMMVLALVPSSSVALVVARSSTAGVWNGAAVAGGIVLGDLVFVFIAVLGMTALAEVLGSFFLVLRYLAGVYLVWLGVSLLCTQAASPVRSNGHSASSLSTSFGSGLLITLGDVKAIFFYASLFPAFIDLSAITPMDVAVIAAVTVVSVGGVKLGYAFAARSIVSRISAVRTRRALTRAAGGVMLGAGAYILAKG